MVRGVVGNNVDIAVEKTDDMRSYHISSQRIAAELGFEPRSTIPDAVDGLVNAFENGRILQAMDDPRYYNIKTMQNLSMR